jgi:flagellar motor switch protein FliM
MHKILEQKEIDAIVEKARADKSPNSQVRVTSIEPCNFQNRLHMSEQDTRYMTAAFESLARSVSHSVAPYLRAPFEMTLASLEMESGRDFIESFSTSGLVAVLPVTPIDSAFIVQMETTLIFPMVDVLLGGVGTPSSLDRELTEIDVELVDGVIQILARQLEKTWPPAAIQVGTINMLAPPKARSVYAPTDKLNVLTFEARLNEASGTVSLIFPTTLALPLLRESSPESIARSHAIQPDQSGLHKRLMNCRFDSTAALHHLKVPLRELISLRPGSVLDLHKAIESPVGFLLGEREYFEVLPVRSGNHRAAQLLRPSRHSKSANEV